jgi:hypothetical protein
MGQIFRWYNWTRRASLVRGSRHWEEIQDKRVSGLVLMVAQENGSSYVVCINDGGYPESLEVCKIYVALQDDLASSRDHIRVIDETGDAYLYPSKLFVPIEVPPEAARILPLSRNSRTR